MYTITFDEFQQRLKDHPVETVNEEGEQIIVSCPNGIIMQPGKPTLVWAFYNNRKYVWELVA